MIRCAIFKRILTFFVFLWTLWPQAQATSWLPWEEQSFAQAKELDRPVLVHLRHRHCPDCERMQQSFQSRRVQEKIQSHFVPILVDRDERADIYQVAASTMQLISGRASLPMTVLFTAEGRPFWAGTYQSYEELNELLDRTIEHWRTESGRQLLKKMADDAYDGLLHLITPSDQMRASINEHLLRDYFNELMVQFSQEHGGFGGSERHSLPAAHLRMLLRIYVRTDNESALEMVTTTIAHLVSSPVYDKRQGGFYHEADRTWQNPSGGKLLVDQAMMAIALTETYQVTQQAVYKRLAQTTAAYVLEHLDSEFGFKASDDDERIFTGWNNLMSAALAVVARISDDEKAAVFYKAAEKNIMRFLAEAGRDQGLFRFHESHRNANTGFLEDYASLVYALLELYQTRFNQKWLDHALSLQAKIDTLFWDDAYGGFFDTTTLGPLLPVRTKNYVDMLMPSGNALSSLNLLRLGAYHGGRGHRERASRVLETAGQRLNRYPHVFASMLIAQDFMQDSYKTLVIVGSKPNTHKLLQSWYQRHFLPNVVMAAIPTLLDADLDNNTVPALLTAKPAINDAATTAYLCHRRYCLLPMSEPAEIEKQLLQRQRYRVGRSPR